MNISSNYMLPWLSWLLMLSAIAAELPREPQVVSDRVSKHLTPAVVKLIQSAQKIESFRVGDTDYEKAGEDGMVGGRIALGEGKILSPELTARAISVFLADRTYFNSDSKGTSTGVAFRISCPDGTLEVSCCLRKGNIWVVAKDRDGKVIHKGDKRGFRDDLQSPLRLLAADVFTDDAEVQKCKPSPSSQPDAPILDSLQAAKKSEPSQPAGNFSATQKADPKSLRQLNQGEFPPGWIPVQTLDDTVAWSDFRKTSDSIRIYFPPKSASVRGVFVCYVFHSSDPRELARLWNFALVTVPSPFEYDLGFYDKRNPRPHHTGLALGNMGLLLSYLDAAAVETNHPELSAAPIVGWLGQNGAPLCADLYSRAPDRVLAWCDAWYQNWPKHGDMVSKVPVASAWEFNNERQRTAERLQKEAGVKDRPTPPTQLRCYATTYGFSHGIYSKYSFFVAYMDRCIKARMPDVMPEPGQTVPLKAIDIQKGWAGDFNEISQWASIAPVIEAKSMIDPIWMPDEYGAWMWRAYHSANPDIKLTAPAIEYAKIDGKWGGPPCGMGYGGTLKATEPLSFSAHTTGTYAAVEFHDGDRIVGTSPQAPWRIEGIRLERGLRVLFAVGVSADGKRTASRPAFVIVE